MRDFYLVLIGMFPGAAIGWWAKTQVLVGAVRIESNGDHHTVYLGNRLIASTHRLSVARARKRRLVATLRGVGLGRTTPAAEITQGPAQAGTQRQGQGPSRPLSPIG